MNDTHYKTVLENVKDKAQLCIVTKKRSLKDIQFYYDQGERLFAENRVNDLKAKAAVLPDDIDWQMIGHLQKNKVKDVVKIVSRIQSLDSIALAELIEKECAKIDKEMNVLLEFHMADEDTNKTGMDPIEADGMMEALKTMPHIHVQGIMAMGPHTDDAERIHAVFRKTRELFESLQNKYGKETFFILSMGMSDDYEIALEEGSTMVRIGTYLFE